MSVSNAMCLAEVGIGALRLGVPVEAVVEAIPLPEAPAQLPRRRGALAGVVEHGGRLVPVVDLARWVEVGATARGDDVNGRAGARVLVLHEDGRTIGLKVDAVGGLVDVPIADVMRLHHDDDPEEVFHSAARAPEGGGMLSVLDAGRLARLAAAWQEDDTQAAQQDVDAQAAADANADLRLYALLQVGAQRLAVPAEALTEVIPAPALERFGGGIDSHWCRWRGRHLPVLPAAALLPALPAQFADAGHGGPLLAVIERGGLALGVPVQAVLQLDSFDGAGLRSADGVTASAFDGDGQPVQLLDDAALFARFPEAALSRDRAQAADGAPRAAHGETQAGNTGAYIVFEADGLAATPIEAIERILGPADAAAALGGALDGALDGSLEGAPDSVACMAWEGRAIPVRELRAPAHADAHADARKPPHLLLVRGAGGMRAVAVARVHLLIPPGTGRVYRMGFGPRALEFITAGEGAAQASYRIVDLAAG